MIRISLPETVRAGEVIEIKAMIQHPMESGYRRDEKGKVIARDIIVSFRCSYDRQPVFEAVFGPGIAANPYLSFWLRATHAGLLEFSWTDQDGKSWSQTRDLVVS